MERAYINVSIPNFVSVAIMSALLLLMIVGARRWFPGTITTPVEGVVKSVAGAV